MFSPSFTKLLDLGVFEMWNFLRPLSVYVFSLHFMWEVFRQGILITEFNPLSSFPLGYLSWYSGGLKKRIG